MSMQNLEYNMHEYEYAEYRVICRSSPPIKGHEVYIHYILYTIYSSIFLRTGLIMSTPHILYVHKKLPTVYAHR